MWSVLNSSMELEPPTLMGIIGAVKKNLALTNGGSSGRLVKF